MAYPDIPLVPLTVLVVGIAIVVPIVFYPFSSTLWAAIDLSMHPLEPDADRRCRRPRRRVGSGCDQHFCRRYLNEQAFEVTLVSFRRPEPCHTPFVGLPSEHSGP